MGLLLDALTLKHHRPLCRMILTSSKASPSVKPLYTELFGRPNPRKEGGEQATKTHPLCVFNRISTQIIDLGPNWTQPWHPCFCSVLSRVYRFSIINVAEASDTRTLASSGGLRVAFIETFRNALNSQLTCW